MRRPLFTNGFPRRLLSDDGTVEVFDTTDFTPQEGASLSFAVTLFCWHWQQYAQFDTAANLPAPIVALATDGSAGAIVAARSAVTVAAAQAAQLGDIAKPIKLLDRFVVRGDQQISIVNSNNNCSVANSMQCFIYGYFESVGEIVPTLGFRPLQPNNNLTSPFSAAPVAITADAPNVAFLEDLHLLSNDYIDLLNINLTVSGLNDVKDIQAGLVFPDGTQMSVPTNDIGGIFQSSPFEYQPMRAAGVIQAGYISSGTVAAETPSLLSAYGDFTRR